MRKEVKKFWETDLFLKKIDLSVCQQNGNECDNEYHRASARVYKNQMMMHITGRRQRFNVSTIHRLFEEHTQLINKNSRNK